MTASGKATFGTTAGGEEVDRITLRSGALTVNILTWGAILQSVRLAGVDHDLTLGSDRLADYEGAMRYHGALVAPVVNRISGAMAGIAGRMHRFEANQDGRHTLHGGSAGTYRKNWRLEALAMDSAAFAVTLPDGEGGFPGNRKITATFTVAAPATLRLEVTATTDKPTLMNVANHSYWNLDGTSGWAGHRLRIAADRYLPTTEDFTPTGEIAATDGTAYDFRAGRMIKPQMPPLDNNFCLSDARVALRDVLWLTGTSGLSMTIATTEPGIQVYDGRNAVRPGRAADEGLAIEPQNWPDAPNHPAFPSIALAPGEAWQQTTEWRFARD